MSDIVSLTYHDLSFEQLGKDYYSSAEHQFVHLYREKINPTGGKK